MKYSIKHLLFTCLFVMTGVVCIELPASCNSSQFYDPGTMTCQTCPVNGSMAVSSNGFSCTCAEHSIQIGTNKCRLCNATELVSTDGKACVPRRCLNAAGKITCRKCPQDYISVTQNLDGTPLKEVQCVKCARGYKPSNNVCVRCESCTCAKHEVVVRGKCLPKKFVNERPKYEQTTMHPNELLDIVKNEYFCTQNDVLACRTLANECVKRFYSTDSAGPCRLWIQPKVTPAGLPKLTIDTVLSDKDPSEIGLRKGMSNLHLALVIYTSEGGLKIFYDPDERRASCFLPLKINIGVDYSADCIMNSSQLDESLRETMAPFLYIDGDLKPLPIVTRKTNSDYVQRGLWPNSKFRRYFLVHKSLSITANMTTTVYLRTLLIRLRLERNKFKSTTLRLHVSIEAQYATKSTLSQTITTTLRVEHEMPSAGVLRSLEIWGGVLAALLTVYAATQWRGNLRRGGLQFCLVPLLAAAVADTLYFAAWFSALHALAAEAGTLGMTLPLSRSEEHMIKVFIYSAVGLKALKVAWVNYSQCKCEIFFLDWSKYNPPLKDIAVHEKSDNWRATALAREWTRLQTMRRAPPAFTVALTLIILHFMQSWRVYLPHSMGYKWAVATLAWWGAYIVVIATRWGLSRVVGCPTAVFPRICTSLGLSLLVFQEEYYAHYVHGRNDDSEARSLVGPLTTCRIICAPQLRAIYKQLASPGRGGLNEKDSKKDLLSKFLATFLERALDGLSWVASERTVLERLLDVELVAREAGSTSILLYDANTDSSPSCFAVTWWDEEWTHGTFDAALFGCVFVATDDMLIAALVMVVTWQVLKFVRLWCGKKNQADKTDIEISM